MLRLTVALMLAAQPFGFDGIEKVVVLELPAEGPVATSVYSKDADWLMIPITGRCLRIHMYPTRVSIEPIEEPEPVEERNMALPNTGYALLTVSNPSSALTDFSLLVDLSLLPQDWWDAVDTTDPTKGRAAKDAGEAELPCDWIAFDSVNETGWLRVKWTGTLATTGTQVLRIYPPVTANASVAAGDTYGQYAAYDSDWAGYWPCEETPGGSGSILDRTSNGNHLTPGGGMDGTDLVDGRAGAALRLSAESSQYLGIADPLVSYPYTAMCWFRTSSTTVNALMSRSLATTTTTQDAVQINTPDAERIAALTRNTSAFVGASSSGTFTSNQWAHAAGVFVADDLRRVYLDSAEDTSTVDRAEPAATTIEWGRLGDSTPGNYYTGDLDELQVHSVARSAAWIAQEYAQTSDPATFWGAPEWVPGDSGGGFNVSWAEGINTYIGVN